ncbi:MAG: hypothetical protein LBC64_06210 [Fibromonadaceae bacterium]|nr:hypothetical protein [Fibromonadaceae bacterium]
MSDIQLTCPHCNMQITFGLGCNSESKDGELLGFVFTCPNCRTPVSYQAKEDSAVELDKNAFENLQRAVKKKTEPEAVAFARRNRPAARKLMDGDMFDSMLKDIKESDNYDDFLKRINN